MSFSKHPFFTQELDTSKPDFKQPVNIKELSTRVQFGAFDKLKNEEGILIEDEILVFKNVTERDYICNAFKKLLGVESTKMFGKDETGYRMYGIAAKSLPVIAEGYVQTPKLDIKDERVQKRCQLEGIEPKELVQEPPKSKFNFDN